LTSGTEGCCARTICTPSFWSVATPPNGWVAEHTGQRTLFLALEFLGHPPHDDLLVVHELTHVAQAQLSVATRAQTVKYRV